MNTAGTSPRKDLGPNKFVSDPQNSTFRWELYLIPGYPGNSRGMIDGYSKGVGPENPNKLILLQKKLVNPVLPYLIRCSEIVIYEQNTVLPKSMHKEVLVLKRDDYFVKQEWLRESPFFINFLETYYSQFVRNGIVPPQEDRRKNARQKNYFQDLDHSKRTFKSLDELKTFCIDRIPTYSRQCMLDWYNIHAQFQPELFQTNDKDDLIHQVHTSVTAEQAQATIAEINRKFNVKK